MNEKQMQFRVGLVVLATMIFGGVLAAINGSSSLGWSPFGPGQYLVDIALPQAPGVDSNTPVRKNGVLIGRVKSIEDNGNGVLVTAKIYGKPLYADFEPHVRTTVLGDATIDFLSRQPAAGAQPVAPGTVFKGFVDPNPFDSLGQLGDLKQEFSAASRSLAQAGDEVSKLANRVNSAFGAEGTDAEGRVQRLLASTERAVGQFGNAMAALNDIIGDGPSNRPSTGTLPGTAPVAPQPSSGTGTPFDVRRPIDTQTAPAAPPFNGQSPAGVPPTTSPQPQGPLATPATTPPSTVAGAADIASTPSGQELRLRIRQGLDELPDAIHEFRITMQDSRTVLKSAERNFKNLETFTEPLGQKGPQISNAILKAVDGLDQLIRDLGEVARALNNRDGTVGKLIHDPQVYENLSRTLFNVNKVLSDIDDLTFNLKPVIHDARVFMDKIATEPGRIVTGGLNPSNVK